MKILSSEESQEFKAGETKRMKEFRRASISKSASMTRLEVLKKQPCVWHSVNCEM